MIQRCLNSLIYIIVGFFQVASILGGGGAVAYRLGRSTARVEAAISLQEKNAENTTAAITEIRTEVVALRALMTDVALQKQEIAQLRQWYDELRRGEGFVYPLGARLKGQT